MLVSTRKCNYEDVTPMWRSEEMKIDRKVSSMKYYDGKYFHGGNDMNVYDLTYSKPVFITAHTGGIDEPLGCISYHTVASCLSPKDYIDWDLESTRIRGIYVKPQYRGNRVATALLRNVLVNTARKPGIKWALVGPNSKRVHEKLGFVQVTDHMHELPDGNKSLHENCYMRWAG